MRGSGKRGDTQTECGGAVIHLELGEKKRAEGKRTGRIEGEEGEGTRSSKAFVKDTNCEGNPQVKGNSAKRRNRNQ